MGKSKLSQLNLYLRPWVRKLILLVMDGCIVCASMICGVFIRFEGAWHKFIYEQTEYIVPILAIYLVILVIGGMYRRMWRYAGVRDLVALCIMMGAAGVVTVVCNGALKWGMSRAVLLLICILSTCMMGGVRLAWRVIKTGVFLQRQYKKNNANNNAPRLMIVGAGAAASYVIRMCENDPAMGQPILLVDDDHMKQGQWVSGVPVRGTTADISLLVQKYGIQEIIIAMPSLKGNKLNKLVLRCKETKCRVRISMQIQRPEKENTKVFIRELNTADFLSRDEVQLDNSRISGYLKGKRVIVTGGGGSIGSELCRQILKYGPELLIVFDIYENCAYELEQELKRDYGKDVPVLVLIGSIRDKDRLDAVMDKYQPQVVFHAAAHKHVPLMESSPNEAVKNNVHGTKNLLESACEHGVERIVQISTDKAVNPTNVMGATKRITELLMQFYSRRYKTKCMAVRFGNVLGSHGSVIPLFERQIKSGGPVTVTHPDMIRYFMTIPEAAQLVLQAGAIADSGAIYVLDMGEPVKISELAEKLIRFYGYEPGKNMEIAYTGLRPGEKLYEELLTDDEAKAMRKTGHNKIMIAPTTNMDDECFEQQVNELIKAAEGNSKEVLVLIKGIVPEYRGQG